MRRRLESVSRRPRGPAGVSTLTEPTPALTAAAGSRVWSRAAPRGTARADALGRDELGAGAAALRLKVGLGPAVVAILRISAYHRLQFGRPRATLGPQPESPGGRARRVVPNLNGRNAPRAVAPARRRLPGGRRGRGHPPGRC